VGRVTKERVCGAVHVFGGEREVEAWAEAVRVKLPKCNLFL